MGIFARVLGEILTIHKDDDYGYLGGQGPRGDQIWYPLRRLGIDPEIVARLKQAETTQSKHFTINPLAFEYMLEQLHFSPQEVIQLRIALLTQGVETFLMDRLARYSSATAKLTVTPDPDAAQDNAQVAAEIATIIYDRLVRYYEPLLGSSQAVLERIRGAYDPPPNVDLDDVLALADRAGELLMAWEDARLRRKPAEERFWKRITLAAYDEVAEQMAPISPELTQMMRAIIAEVKQR